MSKTEFLYELRRRLAGLPQAEIEERIAFYNEMIDDRVEEGLTEEEAVAEIGPVEEIVNQIMAEIPLTTIVRERVKPKRALRAWEIILLVLGSPIWLSLLIAAFAVGLSLYIVLWSLVVCLWAVVVSLAASAVWCLFQVFLYQRAGNPGGALFAGGAALACAGLSILLVFGSLAATKGTARLTKKILLGIKALFVGKETVG